MYDELGHQVAVLADEVKPAGQYNVRFEGTNLSGGLYICKMDVDGVKTYATKMMLLK